MIREKYLKQGLGKNLTWANLITVLGILFVLAAIHFSSMGQYLHTFVFLILVGLSDYYDGKAARYFNQKSSLGEILDPIRDKLLLLVFWPISPFVFVTVLISEALGFIFSYSIRKVKKEHFIAPGSKVITFCQMSIIAAFFLGKHFIDGPWLVFLLLAIMALSIARFIVYLSHFLDFADKIHLKDLIKETQKKIRNHSKIISNVFLKRDII